MVDGGKEEGCVQITKRRLLHLYWASVNWFEFTDYDWTDSNLGRTSIVILSHLIVADSQASA